MISILRKLLKKPLRKAEFWVKSQIASVLRLAFLRINPPITVTLNSSLSVDGTGAQLQRQATIIAFAQYFGFGYIHSDIKQVSVHPLDPFQSPAEYREYLVRLNKFLKFRSKIDFNPNSQDISLPSLSFSRLTRECISQIIRPTPRHFLIFEPYSVTEFCPGIMDALNLQSNEGVPKSVTEKIFTIVIHYRQGVGGFALYPGQNIPREIPIETFVKRVSSVVRELSNDLDWQIFVLTDAPESETSFVPPLNQVSLWEGTPGFSNGVMTISPTRFNALEGFSKLPLQVIRGGNPLDAILMMASADVLFTGKSSLSFLGGLLNENGQVFYPRDFWHRPPQSWDVL
jgi:hypothetical protein